MNQLLDRPPFHSVISHFEKAAGLVNFITGYFPYAHFAYFNSQSWEAFRLYIISRRPLSSFHLPYSFGPPFQTIYHLDTPTFVTEIPISHRSEVSVAQFNDPWRPLSSPLWSGLLAHPTNLRINVWLIFISIPDRMILMLEIWIEILTYLLVFLFISTKWVGLLWEDGEEDSLELKRRRPNPIRINSG